MRSTLILILVGAALTTSCNRELQPSPCTDDDDLTARQVVFTEEGIPLYAGQALMTSSCAGDGAFCHTNEPVQAFGAPAGLNFNVGIACRDDESCTSELQRLAGAQRDVVDWAEHAMAEIENETMPPEESGSGLVTTTYRMGPDPSAAALPTLDTAEGRQILEHWLACGAPVVERSIGAGTLMPGDNCTCVGESCDIVPAAQVGDCYVRAEVQIEPTWSSIYDSVIAPSCAGASCHGAEANPPDLSDAATGYAALIGQAASGMCSDTELPYVEPNDPANSVLYQVLTDSGNCSMLGLMPLGTPDGLPTGVTDAIAEWITAGAMNN